GLREERPGPDLVTEGGQDRVWVWTVLPVGQRARDCRYRRGWHRRQGLESADRRKGEQRLPELVSRRAASRLSRLRRQERRAVHSRRQDGRSKGTQDRLHA